MRLLLAFSLLIAPCVWGCEPVPITLYQNNTLFPGIKGPIITNQTVTEFYAYHFGSYTGGDLPILGNRSVLAIHQDARTCLNSLVVVHSAPNQGNKLGGAAYMYITGELWNPLVKDDPEYKHFVYHDDEYDNFYFRKLGQTLMLWQWQHFDTDGVAHTMVEDWVGCIDVNADFFTGRWIKTPDPMFANRRQRQLQEKNGTSDWFTNWLNDMLQFISNYITFHGSIREWKFVSGTSGELTDLKLDEIVTICLGSADPSNPGPTPFPRETTEGVCENLGEYTVPICAQCERVICHWHIWCNIAVFLNCHFGFNIDVQIPPFGIGT